MLSAAEAPIVARISGSFSMSAESTVTIIWTSLRYPLGEQRPQRPVRHPAGEDRIERGPPLAAREAAWYLTDGIVPFLEIDRQREEIRRFPVAPCWRRPLPGQRFRPAPPLSTRWPASPACRSQSSATSRRLRPHKYWTCELLFPSPCSSPPGLGSLFGRPARKTPILPTATLQAHNRCNSSSSRRGQTANRQDGPLRANPKTSAKTKKPPRLLAEAPASR